MITSYTLLLCSWLHSWSYTFSYYTLMTFLMMLSVILQSMLMILLSTLTVIRHLICDKQNQLLNLSPIYQTLQTGAISTLLISMVQTQLVSFDRSNNTGVIDVKMDGSVLEEKLSLKMLRLTFSSKLDWGSYIISFTKSGALIHSMDFFSPEVALYLYKSIIGLCLGWCSQLLLGIAKQLQKQVCSTIGLSLAASLEPLGHCGNVANLKVVSTTFLLVCFQV